MNGNPTLALESDTTGLTKGVAALKQVTVAAGQAEKAALAQTAATAKASGAMNALGNMSGATKAKVMSFGQQMQDVAIQAQMGTNAFTIAAQQGSQFLSIFGPMGAVLGAVAAISLPLAGAAFTAMGSNAKSAADAAKDFADSAANALAAANEAKAPVADLAKEYGGLASRVKEAQVAQAEFARATSLGEMKAAVDGIAFAFGGFASAVDGLIGSEWEETLYNIRAELDISGAAAVQVAHALEALGNANGPIEVANAAGVLREALISAGVDGANPLIGQLNTAEQAALDLAAAAPKSGWMGVAIGETNLLIGRLIAAKGAQDALNAVSTANRRAGEVYSGRGGDPRDFMSGGKLSLRNASIEAETNAMIASAAKSAEKAQGGASAAASKAEKERQKDIKESEKLALDAAKKTADAWSSFLNDAGLFDGFKDGWQGIADAGLKAAQKVGQAWLQQILLGKAAGQSGGGMASGLLGAAGGGNGGGIGGILGGAAGGAGGLLSLMTGPATGALGLPAFGAGLGALAGPIGIGVSILGGIFGAAQRRREEEERARREAEERARQEAEIEAQRLAAVAKEKKSIEIEILELQGKAAAALALRREEELKGYSDENKALVQKKWALEDVARAAEKAKAALSEDQFSRGVDYRIALAQASIGIVPTVGQPMQVGAGASVAAANDSAAINSLFADMRILMAQIAHHTARTASATEVTRDEVELQGAAA